MKKTTSDQVKGVKPIHFLPLFQNREFKTVEDLLNKKKKKKKKKKTSTCATRPQRCIFMRLFFIGRPKEDCVSVEKNSVPVSLRVPVTSPMF